MSEDHPQMINSLQHLAWVMMKSGRWEEAEPLQAKGVERSKKVLGEYHYDDGEHEKSGECLETTGVAERS